MTAAVTPFNVLGPLPEGVAVLEASAGTGKTFTIAALAARFVAAGVPLENLLIVTFTRMATGELRERVRERLVSAERVLDLVTAGTGPPGDDDVATLLANGSPAEVDERRRRLARAVADFDAATITTTHGFCLEALGSLGSTGDVASDCAFVEDVGDLIDEVVDDLYVRRFWKYDPLLSRDEARLIAQKAIGNPSAHLEPERAPSDTLAALRLRLAKAARDELERRKRQASIMTYDDLLTRLDATLSSPGGQTAAERLRARYQIVLVDEFQDTDPVQWSIMRQAFDHPDGTLVLIGDPKQAIYSFRGADVYAYLEAANTAGTRATLSDNWRSDQSLIDAYDELFGNAQLGHAGIVYRPVRATPANQRPRLIGAPHASPLRLRVVDRSSSTVGTTPKGYARKSEAHVHIARDLTADVVELLSSPAEIEIRESDGQAEGRRRVRPGDLAVLVRRNRDAALVRTTLEAADVPAVINGAGSVFASDAARDWLRLLEALERPTSTPRAHSVALTAFFGWTAAEVAGDDDRSWETVHRRLHHWAHVLRVNGVASLLETITLGERLAQRVLAVEDGERELTDLRHVGQLLHGAAAGGHLGTAALTAWLRRRIAEAEYEDDEERSRRLESDAAAVQVLTIHRSKGLEFPIVYYPYLWTPSWIPQDPQPVFFHDPQHADRRTLDVGLDGSDFATHERQQREELRGEDLRLAYVALTRAQHQAVVWWAGSFDSQDSPLGRLVFARSANGEIAADGAGVPSDDAARARFQALADAAPGCIEVEASVLGPGASWSEAPDEDPLLSASTFDRSIDASWRRTSYSDITAFGHEARVSSEPEDDLVDDEVPDMPAPEGSETATDALRATPSLLSGMPGGVHIGTLVHDLLEATDFAAPDLAAEVELRLTQQRARRSIDVGDLTTVVTGLCAAIETPLGPLADDLSLRGIARADRVDEMTFELPLVGGDEPTATLTPRAIGQLLGSHLPPEDALHGYADRIGDPGLRSTLRGYLTGSIDLAFRLKDSSGSPRYGIVDYKTNWLGDFTQQLTAWDYRPAAITALMVRSHYALQGLLYTVALHRYLRWRISDYDAGRDLAGVFYLFLRGMTGPSTPRVDGTPCGVFAWRPPGPLVEGLSELLDRGAPR